MEKNASPSRLIAVDALRVIAIIAVILIHTTTKTMEVTAYHVLRTNVTFLLNLAARFAVPLFILISGFVLEYRYKDTFVLKDYFRRRVNRILIPYVLWTTLYFLFHTFIGHFHIDMIEYIRELITGEGEYHLYFIPTIILCYALFPFVHKNQHVIFQKKWFILSGLLEVLFVGYDYYFTPILPFTFLRVFLLTYFFFLLGMFTVHHKDRIYGYVEKHVYLVSALSCAALLSIYFETRKLFLMSGDLGYIYSQYRINIYLFTIFFSALLFYLCHYLESFTPVIKMLSRLSFFVFFVHIFVLYMFWYFIGAPAFYKTAGHMADNGLFDIEFFVSVTVASFILAFIVHKIPQIHVALGA